MKPLHKIPLFPLGVVLFPGMPLPLHIFEERYKAMIAECLEQQSVFGVVYYTGENFYKIGCTARIRDVLKRFDDGRMNIVTEGCDRFSIHRVTNDKPYLQGEVEYIDDISDNIVEETELSRAAAQTFKDAVKLINKEDVPDLNLLDAKRISYIIASSAGFSLNERQAFLEMNSTAERLRKATSALRRLMERHKMTSDIESIISGNGYLHNSKL
ncbi:LON peptidase substrate-binding domain-containing protein [bacterium]|nr:LON peptidase substrate-binding domain-containing protein [bacterium]NUN44745.1 LON peptidase substrate-binding domain-containing protein [bacterium]